MEKLIESFIRKFSPCDYCRWNNRNNRHREEACEYCEGGDLVVFNKEKFEKCMEVFKEGQGLEL